MVPLRRYQPRGGARIHRRGRRNTQYVRKGAGRSGPPQRAGLEGLCEAEIGSAGRRNKFPARGGLWDAGAAPHPLTVRAAPANLAGRPCSATGLPILGNSRLNEKAPARRRGPRGSHCLYGRMLSGSDYPSGSRPSSTAAVCSSSEICPSPFASTAAMASSPTSG